MAVKIEDAIIRYLAFRDERAKLKTDYEFADNKLKEIMEKIEVWFMKQMDAGNVEAFKTAAGTAYTSKEYKASCADWPGFWEFMADQRRFDLLEKRVGIGGIKSYLEEKGELPPFINLTTERVVRVRRT